MVTDIPQVLGQAAPVDGSEVDIFTATSPGILNTILVCNRTSGLRHFSVAYVPGGVPTSDEHWIYLNHTIGAKTTFIATTPIGFESGDVVRVVDDEGGSQSFTLSGMVIA